MGLALFAHVLPQIHDARRGRLHLNEARHVIAVHFGADSRKRAFLDGHAHIVVSHIHALVQPLEHDIAALDEHRAHAAGGDAAVIGHGLLLLVGHHGAGRRLDEAVLQRERTDLQLGEHSGVGEVLDAVGRKVPVLGIDLRVGRRGASRLRQRRGRRITGRRCLAAGLSRTRLRGAPAQKPKPKRACTQGRRAYAAQKPAAAYRCCCFRLFHRAHASLPFSPSTRFRSVLPPHPMPLGSAHLPALLAALAKDPVGSHGGDEGTVGRKPSSTHRPDGGNCENISSIDPLVR